MVVKNSKEMCRLAFQTMVNKNPNIFGTNIHKLFYDLQSIFYSIKKLAFEDEEHFELNEDDCASIQEFQRFKEISIMVKTINQELNLGDFSGLTSDSANQNYSLQQFIELATSQSALFNP